MCMKEVRELRKIKNSIVISIPEGILDILQSSEGDKIAFRIEDNKVTLEPVNSISEKDNILSLAEKISTDYNDALKDLVER